MLTVHGSGPSAFGSHFDHRDVGLLGTIDSVGIVHMDITRTVIDRQPTEKNLYVSSLIRPDKDV